MMENLTRGFSSAAPAESTSMSDRGGGWSASFDMAADAAVATKRSRGGVGSIWTRSPSKKEGKERKLLCGCESQVRSRSCGARLLEEPVSDPTDPQVGLDLPI